MGDKAHRAKLAFSIVILGAVWSSVPACVSASAWTQKCSPGTRKEPFHFQKAGQTHTPGTAHSADLRHREMRGEASCPGGTDWQGHIGMQTPTLALAPLQLPQENWRMVGGPGARQQRLGCRGGSG